MDTHNSNESCLHNRWYETRHQYPGCLFQLFQHRPSSLCFGKLQASKTGKSRKSWQNPVSLTITRGRQSNLNSFAGTQQTNINNTWELNKSSAWLVLSQLLRKLTQSSSPAGRKMCSDCHPGVVLKKDKTRLHISDNTFYHFTVCTNSCLSFIPRVCCIYSSAGKGLGTSAGGFSLINLFSCLVMVNNGKIQKSNPSQITFFSTTDGALWQPGPQYLFL